MNLLVYSAAICALLMYTPIDKERTIFGFDQAGDVNAWRSINDGVMGGVSAGRLVAGEAGTAIFEGDVSLENFGGFASVRTTPTDFGLAGYDRITIRVRGDGKQYKLCLKADALFDGVIYQSGFETRNGEWITVSLALSEFKPTFRGRTVYEAGPIDAARIRSFGLMISDKQEGRFRLEIDWIKATSAGQPVSRVG